MSEILNPNWGYTEKDEIVARPLTPQEHNQLEEQRQRKLRLWKKIAGHTQVTVDSFINNDPTVRGTEMVVVIIDGYRQFKEISETIGFEQLTRKFHFGAPFKKGWLEEVADAVELRDRFPNHLHFLGDEDISKQLNRWVSPYSFDPANVGTFFEE